MASEKVYVDNPLALEYEVASRHSGISIYALESGIEGILVGGEKISWEEMANVIEKIPEMHHVFGIGNAYLMEDHLSSVDNVHFEECDVVDLRLTVLYAAWSTAEILSTSDNPQERAASKDLRKVVLKDVCENINELMSSSIMPQNYTGEKISEEPNNPKLRETWAREIPQYSESGESLNPLMRLAADNDSEDYIKLRKMSPDSGIGGPIGWLIEEVLYALVDEGLDSLEMHVDAAAQIVNYVSDVVNETKAKVVTWFEGKNITLSGYDFKSALPELLPKEMFELWTLGDSLINDAFYKVDDWVGDYVEQIINTPVQTKLKGLTPVFLFRLGTPINLGSNFASFGAVLRVKLLPDFEVDKTFFEAFMNQAIFGSKNLTKMSDTETAFIEVRKFIDIIPVMDLEMGICAFLPIGNSWTEGILGDFDIHFFGSASIQLAFPPIDASGTERSFIDVRAWALKFELDAEYSLSVKAFLGPASVGGAIIGTIMEYVEELLSMTLTLTLSVIFEISKKYAGQGLPAKSTILVDVVIGVVLNIRILVAVFRGSFQVGTRFEQTTGGTNQSTMAQLADEEGQFVTSSSGVSTLGVYFTLYCSLYLGIDLFAISFGTDFGGPWTETWDISGSWGSPDYGSDAADLTDTDGDGLPDDFENRMNTIYGGTYLNPSSSDTDSDGLNDKLELEINTFPNDVDSDDDGLNDYAEKYTWLTNPLLNDTDWDNITDYDECIVYNTNPLLVDTDADGLHDWYEINTVYDISNVQNTYGFVDGVEIGGVTYNDRTDPLSADTDNDGLLDGDEWENGVQYANQSLIDAFSYVKMNWTHPLDKDTDDDSVVWGWEDSEWKPQHDNFLWDWNDGKEVHGEYFTLEDEEGYPTVQLVKTNPCHPDTDNDTYGITVFNTDTVELTQVPPSDPTDGDTDHDGLIDGREKIAAGYSGTFYADPDTDDDHLPDYEDVILPTDQRDPDTDDDLVLDGDEYYTYGTDPCNNDTDLDGLTDGEELFFFYSNPNVRDSDLDGVDDGEEILVYLTDPLVNDTDGDGLADGYEILVSKTDPRVFDTDEDGLGDGAELNVWNTNPLDWDTDGDSMTQLTEHGNMTFPWGDGAEVEYGTDPTEIDSDSDGLSDAQELYIADGGPTFNAIPLDPLDNDTDNDNLEDGKELIVENVTLITYPYVGLQMRLRWGSCPVLNDTDDDGLRDDLEIEYSCDPSDKDTDNDMITDYAEIFLTNTNPLTNDTDGDEIPDNVEAKNVTEAGAAMLASEAKNSFIIANQEFWPLFPTSATDSDSDDDLLPDGIEYLYNTNPLDNDTNENGILDGYEYDADEDGLSDGEEFYIAETWNGPLPIRNGSWYADPGGFMNPDSDGDGLNDGDEVHTHGTDPTSSDSDGDGMSDYEEVQLGENPVIPVTQGLSKWVLLGIGIAGGFAVGIIAETSVILLRRRREKKSGKSKKKSKKKKSSKGGGKK
jgi:hypothetical protein